MFELSRLTGLVVAVVAIFLATSVWAPAAQAQGDEAQGYDEELDVIIATGTDARSAR